MVTKEQLGDAITMLAIAESIQQLGEVPSGHLYAAVMGSTDLLTYERVVGLLVRSGLVARRGDLLIWVGPVSETQPEGRL